MHGQTQGRQVPGTGAGLYLRGPGAFEGSSEEKRMNRFTLWEPRGGWVEGGDEAEII